MTASADAINLVIQIARSQVGIKESPAGSNRTKYGAEFGWNGVPWCAEFLWWVFDQAGLADLVLKSASADAVYRHAKAAGRVDHSPSVGAIPAYDWDGDGVVDHIAAAIVRVSGGTFDAIEGNTSPTDAGSQSNGGMVALRTRRTSQAIGFIHPAYEEAIVTIGKDDLAAIEKLVNACIDAKIPAIAEAAATRYQVRDKDAPGGLEVETKAVGDIQDMVKQMFTVLTALRPGGPGGPGDVQAFAAATAALINARPTASMSKADIEAAVVEVLHSAHL